MLYETMESKNQEQEKLLPVDDTTFFGYVNGNKLYFVLWERIGNSGYILIYAASPEEAWERTFKLNPFVRHTIVEVSKDSVPVSDNRLRR